MILILLSWIYILFTTINLGFGTDKLFQLKNQNFVIYSILGLFTTTVFASFWAIFGKVNIEFHLFLILLNIGLFLKFKKEIQVLYQSFFKELLSLTNSLKIISSLIAVLILAQCASIPYVIDNESYYIQTIKWINEYGFVKGLANLHFFLAQTSGWHITQSAFNFSFLYDQFNDLSGFCLLLGNIFCILKLNDYFKNQDKSYLIIGLFPLANVFLFQFISTPSPDIPIYVFSFILFFYFFEKYQNTNIETFNLIVILVLFSLYIKTTALVLAAIPLVLLIKNFKNIFPKLLKSIVISIIILLLFLTKNSIISGYPIFPIADLHLFQSDYRIPETIAKLYYQETKLHAYFLSYEQYNKMAFYELFIRWLTLPKLHGLFNKLSVILIIISPTFIYKYFNKKEIWVLYFIMCLQMLMLFLSSPQYRFFINFVLLFSFLLMSLIAFKRQTIVLLLYIFTFITGFALLVPINLNYFTKNKFGLSPSNFTTKNTIYPYKNTKSDTGFERIKNGNLHYYSPIKNDFFWGSGDGKLPCVNKEQIEYFDFYYKIKPQMRSTNLKDGFYAKDTSKE
jgi:hypothetical protein